MTQSEQFLMEAFAGESQANRRYLAFAQQAEKEGYPQVAKLFRAAAEAETGACSRSPAGPKRDQEYGGKPESSHLRGNP
jgi:rubrerythrin